jgi:DNA-binding transcriptional LysR family regulator
MEIRQLRFFLSTVRQGNLGAAAREHFVTQPAVSIQLKKLEEEVGEKLYNRRGRRIEPTQAGEMLAAEADEIIARVDALVHRIKGLKGLESGVLRMGAIDAASVYVLPHVYRAFREKYPGIDIQVDVSATEGLLQALESRAIELAIVTLPLPGGVYDVIPVFEDKMVLVAPPRHVLTRSEPRKKILRRVAETGLITYPAKSTTRRLIEKVFIDNGLSLRVTMETSSPEAIKKLTEAGLGASILPLGVVSNEVKTGTLEVIPTGKARFVRMLGLVCKNMESLSPPAKVFLDMLLDKKKSKRTK